MTKSRPGRRTVAKPQGRGKARVGDEELVSNESAPLGERTSALFRLAVDRSACVEPIARAWLERADPTLRGEAVGTLLFLRCADALQIALDCLPADPSPQVRGTVAAALAAYWHFHPEATALVARALFERVTNDLDSIVQRTCYEALLHQLDGLREPKLPFDFDARVHVDWELLSAWIQRLVPK